MTVVGDLAQRQAPGGTRDWGSLFGEFVADRWTYREFDDLIASVAGGLHERGIGAGDRLHVVLDNGPAFVAVWLAASRLGAVIVPADPRSPSFERMTKPSSPHRPRQKPLPKTKPSPKSSTTPKTKKPSSTPPPKKRWAVF